LIPLINRLEVKSNKSDSKNVDLEDTPVTSISAITTATVSLKNKLGNVINKAIRNVPNPKK
jgi:hypothetical protein